MSTLMVSILPSSPIKIMNSADSQFSNLGFRHIFPVPVPIPSHWLRSWGKSHKYNPSAKMLNLAS